MAAYHFKHVLFDSENYELYNTLKPGSDPVSLRRQLSKVLECLINKAERWVPRDTLYQACWEGGVEKDGVRVSIYQLRESLEKVGCSRDIIESQRVKGYRLNASIAPQPPNLICDNSDAIFDDSADETTATTFFPIDHVNLDDHLFLSNDDRLLMITHEDKIKLFDPFSEHPNIILPPIPTESFKARILDTSYLPLHKNGGLLCRIEFSHDDPRNRLLQRRIREHTWCEWELDELAVEGATTIALLFYVLRQTNHSTSVLGFITADMHDPEHGSVNRGN